jgi:hypothetical protein
MASKVFPTVKLGTQYNTHNQDYGVRQGPANKLNE